MRNKQTLVKIIVVLLTSLPILGCITMSYFFDFDPNAPSKGTIYHEISLPIGNEDQTSVFDNYIQKLYDQGWENIEIGTSEDGLFQLTATYDFDLISGRGLPEDLQKSITITSEETESGDVLTNFEAELNFSQIQNSWNEVVNNPDGDTTIDLGKWLGGSKTVISREEIDELIEKYGEPSVFFNVRLPGNKFMDASQR